MNNNSKVLALKYRPITFQDLIGQEITAETIFNSIKSMILMVQKEVALRLSAVEKTKNYGRISVLTQVLANVDIKFDVKPENFYPKPKVDSSVIEITPKKKVKFNYHKLNKTLTISFSHKRKTLKNKKGRTSIRPCVPWSRSLLEVAVKGAKVLKKKLLRKKHQKVVSSLQYNHKN